MWVISKKFLIKIGNMWKFLQNFKNIYSFQMNFRPQVSWLDENCSFQIFFCRIFLSIFCPLWPPPQFLNFASQILKNNNSSWKTYWKSRVYHLGNIHAKFYVSKTITLVDNWIISWKIVLLSVKVFYINLCKMQKKMSILCFVCWIITSKLIWLNDNIHTFEGIEPPLFANVC